MFERHTDGRQRDERHDDEPPHAKKLIGTCGFHCWDQTKAQAEIGYDLSPLHWGRGLMREALETIIAFGFDSMSLAVISAIAEQANVRSLGLLKRLGFEIRPDLIDPADPTGVPHTLLRPS